MIAHICRFVNTASSQRWRRKIRVEGILRNFDRLHSPVEEGIRVEKHIAITLRTTNLTSSVGEFKRGHVPIGVRHHQDSSSPAWTGTNPVCSFGHSRASLESLGDSY